MLPAIGRLYLRPLRSNSVSDWPRLRGLVSDPCGCLGWCGAGSGLLGCLEPQGQVPGLLGLAPGLLLGCLVHLPALVLAGGLLLP